MSRLAVKMPIIMKIAIWSMAEVASHADGYQESWFGHGWRVTIATEEVIKRTSPSIWSERIAL